MIELVGGITDGASATNTSKSVAKINSAEGRVNIQNQRRPNIAPQYLASIWNETNIARYLANFWIGVWQHRNRPGIDLAWQLVFADTLRPFISWRLFLHQCKIGAESALWSWNSTSMQYNAIQAKDGMQNNDVRMPKGRGCDPLCVVDLSPSKHQIFFYIDLRCKAIPSS